MASELRSRASGYFDIPGTEFRGHPSLNAFCDQYGRHLLLRGLNLGSGSKMPDGIPIAGTPDFYDASKVSYLTEPFNGPEEAREWMERMANWGVSCVRFVVVWEAIEPRKL